MDRYSHLCGHALENLADKTDPRRGQTCEEIGHPYTALPGDPHDGDHDGIACED
jgi:hypothetical protein